MTFRFSLIPGAICSALLTTTTTLASDAGIPSTEVLEGLYPGETYSPCAQRSFPSRVFWGDTHLHTGLSLDAGLFGNTLGPDEAYRFARGEEVVWYDETLSFADRPLSESRPAK